MTFALRIGRMLSGSKSSYRMAHPDHVIVFNGNICTRSGGKIWYGDLDLTIDADALTHFARECGEELFILREMDARFSNESAPLLQNAVARFLPTGDVIRSAA